MSTDYVFIKWAELPVARYQTVWHQLHKNRGFTLFFIHHTSEVFDDVWVVKSFQKFALVVQSLQKLFLFYLNHLYRHVWRKAAVWSIVKACVDFSKRTLTQKLTSLHILEFFVEWTFNRIDLIPRLRLIVRLLLFNFVIFRKCARVLKLTGGKIDAYSFNAIRMTVMEFIPVCLEAFWVLACTSVHALESMLMTHTCRCFSDFFTRYKFDSLSRLILHLFRQLFEHKIVNFTFL